MTKRPQIGHDRTSGQEIANDEVGQHLQGGQGQVGGPQVPLLGHGNEIKSPNWACRDCGHEIEYDEELGTRTPASLGGMLHPLLPLS